MKCPACGQDNREGAAFCDACGSSFARACPACNAQVRPEARFCDTCGSQLEGPVPADIRTQTPAHLVQKILRDRNEIEGERRTVTVLFVDAKGYTPLSEQLDPEQVYGFMQGAMERMLASVHRYEGTVTQFTGDGIMATFGAPIAHEDSARRAVAAALDMQRSLAEYVEEAGLKTAFRCGLNTGPVVVGRIGDDLTMEYTAVGDTTNLAARMEQMCEPGSVYVTELTYRDVSDYFDCEDLGPLEVKGKSQPVRVLKAVRERAVRTRLDAAVARGLSPFVGRDRDLETLRGLWNEALAGRGQIVLISGEPGIGKSRLLLEFHRALGEDVIWREAHCVTYGEHIPYLPVIELVRNGFGIGDADDEGTIIQRIDEDTSEWSPEAQKTVPYLKFLLQVDPGDAAVEQMDPMQRRAGILDALRALILERARVSPRVVVVEDLHWADDQSEEAFRVCADVVAASPVLMILTFRPGYLHPSADLPHAHRLVLGDLDSDARKALAGSALAAADMSAELTAPVTRKAEGNPLFIEEVAKALGSGAADPTTVPNSLQDVILARIDRLERGARESLQLASVIGREFTLRLLNRISDLQSELEGVLSELKTLELIYEKTFFPELAYMFKHALTHDVAYSTLLVERRKTLHRIVAAAIEELYSDRLTEHYETLAHHYEKAEDWPKALEYLELSADKAAASYATREARDFFQRAMDVCDRLGPELMSRAVGMADRQGLVVFAVGDVAEAGRAFERMLAYGRAMGDARLEGFALARLGFVRLIEHEFAVAEELLRSALDVGGVYDDVRYFADCVLLMNLLVTNRHAEAEPFHNDAAELAERVDDPFTAGWWGEIGGIIPNWRGDYRAALEHLSRWGGVIDDSEAQHIVMINLGVLWVQSVALGGAGRYQEGIDLLRNIISNAQRVGDVFYLIRALNTLGWLYAEIQNHAEAQIWNERCLEEAAKIETPDPEMAENARLNLGDILLTEGRLDEAEECFAHVENVYRNPAPADHWMLWRYGQHMMHSYGELWLARGDIDKAMAYADECVANAERTESRKNVVKGRRLRGRALMARADLEGAEREIEAALTIAREIGNPPQLWKTLVALGDLRTAQSHDEDARSAFSEALAVIDGVADGLTDGSFRKTFLDSSEVLRIKVSAM